MPPKSLFLLCFGAFLLLGQDATAQTGSELANALWRNNEITLHLRSLYLRRERNWQNGSLAWAGGGWLAYLSGAPAGMRAPLYLISLRAKASSGDGLSYNREANLTADYRFSAGNWPQWTKPLSLRARLARHSQKSAQQDLVTDEFHFSLKYTVDFK